MKGWLAFPFESRPFILSILTLLVLNTSCAKPPTASSSGDPSKETGGIPPQDPILRLETGMHTASISRIGVDQDNHYVVTASDDKTVRVWDFGTGKLLNTLRPPIGDGHEGKIFALAMSPDGQTVACAGWTGLTWNGSFSVYLFNRINGQLTNQLTGLPASVSNLVYSLDGRLLLVGLHSRGIRIYRTSDLSLVVEDRGYAGGIGAGSYGGTFDQAGRLVTSSFDGFLRLYDSDFQLLARKDAPGGKKPFKVSFSPNGEKVAVGFADSPEVNVLSGLDLSYLYSPEVSNVKEGELNSVVWSADGEFLYAGGTYRVKGGLHPIRQWAQQGRGKAVDYFAANNTILDLAPLRTGGLVFSSADAVFGAFDNQGHRFLYHDGDLPDYRDNRRGFRVSQDGTIIQFGYRQWGKETARFSIAARALEPDPRADHAIFLSPPPLTAKDLIVEGWKNEAVSTASSPPTLNGRPLALDSQEVARSFAISPDHQSVLFGTSWNLRLVDRRAREIWRTEVPADAWAVNIAGDGKIAVVALGDGTIRWYRLRDGQETLAFFPHADQRRWILWTPSGYYDSAPGSDTLIGWHKNYTANRAADFFPLARFRSMSYRPNIVAKMVELWDEKEAVRLAKEVEVVLQVDQDDKSEQKLDLAGLADAQFQMDKNIQQKWKEIGYPAAGEELHLQENNFPTIYGQIPPVVIIHSPRDGDPVSTRILTVHYSVVTPPQAPVTKVTALVDGQPAPKARGIRVQGTTPSSQPIYQLKVPIPNRDCEISLLASHQWSTSQPMTVRVRWMKPIQEELYQPKLYVLAVGVSQYKDPSSNLPYAAQDAQAFAETLKKEAGGLYRDTAVKVLTNTQATRSDILDGLDWLNQETTSRDVAVLFLSGQAAPGRGGASYFMPANADLDRLRRTALGFSDIKNTVVSMAGKTLLFIDTCHSNAPLGPGGCSAGINAMVKGLSNAQNDAVIFAASIEPRQPSEETSLAHSPFTLALLEGFRGEADYQSTGTITVSMLDLYVSGRVKELTKGKQRSTTLKPATIQDFPVTTISGATTPDLPTSTQDPIPPKEEIVHRLPPVITILSPLDSTGVSSTEVTIRYAVKTPSGDPVTEVTARIDGRPVPTPRGIRVVERDPSGQEFRNLQLRIPMRDCSITLLAKNRWGISEASTIRLVWQGPVSDSPSVSKPNLYVLAIGVGQYENPNLIKLKFATKDVRDFVSTIKRQKGRLYQDVIVKTLTDADVTRDSILDALDWIDHKTTPKDVAMIFLAGHGVNDKGGIYYFLPVDAQTDRLRRTALPFSDIKHTVASLAGKTLLFVDTCHAGNIMGMRRGVADINAVVNELTSAENGAVVFASSTGRQSALEDAAWGNGAFTKALVEGLTGKADFSGEGYITVNMLDLYLSERVKELTDRHQTPTTTKPQTIRDFPIAMTTNPA